MADLKEQKHKGEKLVDCDTAAMGYVVSVGKWLSGEWRVACGECS